MFNVRQVRKDFPILSRKIKGRPLVYLDNGATSQKPQQVLEAINEYYTLHNANINRGVYTLAEESTNLYEKSRQTVAAFINAKKPLEIIFVRNATEAINLVAYAWGRTNIRVGDEIIVTEMEHHSNLVPWQLLAAEKGASLRFIPFDEEGKLKISILPQYVNKKTKLVTLVHVSNTLGTINDIENICSLVKKINPKTLILVDGSQSVPHFPIDVQKLGCDFFAFTGHKMLGPMGIGVLWAKEERLESMPPFLAGGDMIREVHLDYSTWNDLPAKFEAGTPNVAGAVGLAAAVNYLNKLGMINVREHEKKLTRYALSVLKKIKGVRIFGPQKAELRGGLVAFSLLGVHPHDVAQILDRFAICLRSGHHCTMPLHEKLAVPATLRASFYIYNTEEEIDLLGRALLEVKKIFKV